APSSIPARPPPRSRRAPSPSPSPSAEASASPSAQRLRRDRQLRGDGRDQRHVAKFLAGEDGKTLYVFKRDTDNTSNCSDSCAQTWPPFTLESGEKVSGFRLGVAARSGAPGRLPSRGRRAAPASRR